MIIFEQNVNTLGMKNKIRYIIDYIFSFILFFCVSVTLAKWFVAKDYLYLFALVATILCQTIYLGSSQKSSRAIKEELDKFSVDKHINNEITPPTFIWTTSGDTAVDPVNTLKYATALNEAKIPFELHIFPGGKHGMTTGKYGVVADSKDPTYEYISVWPEYSRKWLKTLFDI